MMDVNLTDVLKGVLTGALVPSRLQTDLETVLAPIGIAAEAIDVCVCGALGNNPWLSIEIRPVRYVCDGHARQI